MGAAYEEKTVMTDANFTAQLDYLLHQAREMLGHLDSGINHANALAERYQQLEAAIENAEACKASLRARMLQLISEPATVTEMQRRRVA